MTASGPLPPTLRLLHNYLNPLAVALQGEPERLGQVWELRRC